MPPSRVAEASKSPGSRVAGGPKSCGKSCGSERSLRVAFRERGGCELTHQPLSNRLWNRSECYDTRDQLSALLDPLNGQEWASSALRWASSRTWRSSMTECGSEAVSTNGIGARPTLSPIRETSALARRPPYRSTQSNRLGNRPMEPSSTTHPPGAEKRCGIRVWRDRSEGFQSA